MFPKVHLLLSFQSILLTLAQAGQEHPFIFSLNCFIWSIHEGKFSLWWQCSFLEHLVDVFEQLLCFLQMCFWAEGWKNLAIICSWMSFTRRMASWMFSQSEQIIIHQTHHCHEIILIIIEQIWILQIWIYTCHVRPIIIVLRLKTDGWRLFIRFVNSLHNNHYTHHRRHICHCSLVPIFPATF